MSSSVFLSTFLLPSLAASTQQTPATGQQFIGPIPIINPSECTNAETFMLTISVNFSVFKKLGKHPALSTSANMHRRTGYPYDCYAWAQAGECDRNPSFMRDDKVCQKIAEREIEQMKAQFFTLMKDGKSKEAVDLMYPDTPLLATNGTDLIETKAGVEQDWLNTQVWDSQMLSSLEKSRTRLLDDKHVLQIIHYTLPPYKDQPEQVYWWIALYEKRDRQWKLLVDTYDQIS